MLPGVNDGPRSTGTVPKSNRRSDRNRERSAANQQITNRSGYPGHSQLSNNLYQIHWQPVSEREPLRTTKNSNKRLVSSVASTSYQDISDFASLCSRRQYNYSLEECIPWQKMGPPSEPQSQSPPCQQGAKPNNVDKMPERGQIESRLNQIRDYIRVTTSMMDSLNHSTDPRARAQSEKLSRMVEDLHDSERKLSKLLEQYIKLGLADELGDYANLQSNQVTQLAVSLDATKPEDYLTSVINSINGVGHGGENGDASAEMQLRRKMEESQRKLAQLQEHQANLVDIQMRVRERLNEARQAQQVLLQQENQIEAISSQESWENTNSPPVAMASNSEQQLESETVALRGKLAQLQNKKKHMDQLVSELHAIELSDKGSCSSEGSRNIQDKTAELEAMKAQLAHLKTLMDETSRMRDCLDSTSEPEPDADGTGEGAGEVEASEEDGSACNLSNSFDRQSDTDEMNQIKCRNSDGRPTVEDLQAITRELKEQSVLLQAARSELQRLKQPLMATLGHPSNTIPTSTPTTSLMGLNSADKKQSNHLNGDPQSIQMKRRPLGQPTGKAEEARSSSSNREVGSQDWNSQRGSNSQLSHASAPGNLWPPPANADHGSNEQSVDGISSSENLLDIGPQQVENGFNGNWWACPTPSVNQLQQGSTEYYRQLLLGSQAQQLQMMGTTIQQCCQLLWAQQRELQAMRGAISQLQVQVRQSQTLPRASNVENQEEYSNLSRNPHHLGDTPDTTLPPSSSLPNLVSLPHSSPAPSSQTPVSTPAGSHQQQQQLNNQVPPGNRANNYWDNFRSYSRQNLLSGNVKTVTDVTAGPASNSVSSANMASGRVNSSLTRDKRNREQGTDNLALPSLTGAEAQYSLNLQLPSNLQQQERENSVARNNILTNETAQPQSDNFWDSPSSLRVLSFINDSFTNDYSQLSTEIKETLTSLISSNRRRPDYLLTILKEIRIISENETIRPFLLRSLRALQNTQSLSNPLNEVTDQTASESCQSSDEDSEVGAMLAFNLENSVSVLAESTSCHAMSSSMAQLPLIDHLEMPPSFPLDTSSNFTPINSTSKPGYNEDLAEADQSRPESAGNQQQTPIGEADNDEGQEEAASLLVGASATPEIAGDLDAMAAKAEDERAEDSAIDRIPTRLYHRS